MSHDKDSYVVAWASFRIVLTCFFMAVTSFSRPVSSKLLVANSDAGWLKYPRLVPRTCTLKWLFLLDDEPNLYYAKMGEIIISIHLKQYDWLEVVGKHKSPN